MPKKKLTRDRLRSIIAEEKQKLQKEQKVRTLVRQELKKVLGESEAAEKAASDADDMMSDEDMSKEVAAKAAAKKHDTTTDAVKNRMNESDVRKAVRSKIREVLGGDCGCGDELSEEERVRERVRKALNEVRPKDYRTARRKLARYLESHAVTDTQMDDLVSLVSQQGLPGGLDEWMDMHAEGFMNLNRDRLEDLLVSSGVAQA